MPGLAVSKVSEKAFACVAKQDTGLGNQLGEDAAASCHPAWVHRLLVLLIPSATCGGSPLVGPCSEPFVLWEF